MQHKRRDHPLTVRYPHCAGIDIGKTELYVAVAKEADDANVRTLARIRKDYRSSRVGWAPVGLSESQWRRPGCIGYPCMNLWIEQDSKCDWLTLGLPSNRTGARRMCWIVNGYDS